ncbi:MFS transporter [Paenibacillus tianmuensis]|uniref:MFS transporter n=1 Tax=Paenibacillus tianmuensis TaxID=624147 RepID=UPI00316AE053
MTWRWLFLIHVPAAVIATFLAYRYIPARQIACKPQSFDSVGAVCFAAAIGFLIYGVSTASSGNGWGSAQTWIPFVVSGMSLLILLRWEFRHPAPFFSVHLMRKPMLGVGLAVSLLSFALANVVLVAAPFYLLAFARIDHAMLGYVMTAYPILLAVMGPLAGGLSDRYGPKRLIISGLGAMGAGSLLMVLFLNSLSLPGMIVVLALFGTGMGLIASPNNSFMMNHTPAAYSGVMGSMIALTRNMGMVLGAAIGLGLLSGRAGGSLQHEADAFYMIFMLNLILSLVALGVFVLVTLKSRRLAASGIDS